MPSRRWTGGAGRVVDHNGVGPCRWRTRGLHVLARVIHVGNRLRSRVQAWLSEATVSSAGWVRPMGAAISVGGGRLRRTTGGEQSLGNRGAALTEEQTVRSAWARAGRVLPAAGVDIPTGSHRAAAAGGKPSCPAGHRRRPGPPQPQSRPVRRRTASYLHRAGDPAGPVALRDHPLLAPHPRRPDAAPRQHHQLRPGEVLHHPPGPSRPPGRPDLVVTMMAPTPRHPEIRLVNTPPGLTAYTGPSTRSCRRAWTSAAPLPGSTAWGC